MAAKQIMLSEFPWDPGYSIAGADEALTPALVLYPEIVASNIERTLELLGGMQAASACMSKRRSWGTAYDCWSIERFALSNARPPSNW